MDIFLMEKLKLSSLSQVDERDWELHSTFWMRQMNAENTKIKPKSKFNSTDDCYIQTSVDSIALRFKYVGIGMA